MSAVDAATQTLSRAAPARQKWIRLMEIAGALAVALLVYNGLAFNLALHGEEHKLRNPETGLLTGAEPRELGPEDSPCAALFIHGFGGAGTDFADLPERLAEAGWRVHVMLLPGHGTHPRDLGRQTPDTLLSAVHDVVHRLRERHTTVLLISHSMGGALSTLATSELPIDGLVLGAPYFGVTYRWYYALPPEQWGRITAPFIRWVYKGKLFMQVNRRDAREHIVCYTWIPATALRTLTRLGARARSHETLEKIACPVLVLHGRGDIAASPQAMEKALERMASQNKRVVWLERSNHHMYWDYDQEQVFDETLAFAQQIREAKNPAPS